MAFSQLKLFGGSSSKALSQNVADLLQVPLAKAELHEFADGESFVEIHESVRGKDVFVIQSTCTPVNSNYVQLLLMVDAFKRASAKKINVVMPYFGYSRQDRLWGRSPISASLLARFVEDAGADSFMSFDLHSAATAGFFSIPVDNLSATGLFADYFNKKKLGEVTIVSPDVGGAKRAHNLARKMGAELAIVHKQRTAPNKAEVHSVVGEVKGKICILADDIVDTGGTPIAAAQALQKAGAKEVYAAITHPVLSGEAIEKLEASPIKEIVVTDSIPLRKQSKKIKVVSLAPMIAESIRQIHEGGSINSIFSQ